MDKKIKLRNPSNIAILNQLLQIITKYPELRFQQILIDFKIVEPGKDKFYEESYDTLNNLIKNVKTYKGIN